MDSSNETAVSPAPAHSVGPEDLFSLKDGGYDKALNKHIKEVVLVSDDFVVYLATDLTIQWQTTEEQEWDKRAGEVLNQVALLETRSRFIHDPVILAGIRRQIAEGLVRYLDGLQTDSALVVLGEAAVEIEARNKEVCWDWYFRSAYVVTFISVVTLALLWVLRFPIRGLVGGVAFDILMGTLCGAVGALISVTTRGDRLYLDANAGKRIHTFEGLSRIGVGLASAAFVALAIKGGALLGGAHFAGSQFALLLAFCIAAGASERMVPNLIGKIERVAATPANSQTNEKGRKRVATTKSPRH